MQIPIPESIAKELANRAVIRARAKAPRSKQVKEHGADFLYPVAKNGSISIGVPKKYKYMIFQDKGTKPHTQVELAGKTIPIRGAGGKIQFRYVNPAKIGIPVPVRDEHGIMVGSKLSWTHPGLKPKHFIESSINDVVSEWKSTITKKDALKMLEQSPEFKDLLKKLKGK